MTRGTKTTFLESNVADGNWWKRNRVFWLIILSAAFYNLGISLILFLHSLFLADLGWREQPLGAVNSAMVFGGVLAVVPTARLAAGTGLGRVLSSSLLVTAVAFAGRLWLTGYTAQIALSLAAGVALAGWIVCVSPAVAAAVPEARRPAAFNVLFAVSLVTGGLGGVLGGFVPGWLQQVNGPGGTSLNPVDAKRFTLLLGGVFLALAAYPAMKLRGAVQPQPTGIPPSRGPFLLRFLLASACWSVVIGAFSPFASLFFAQHLRVSLPRVSLIFFVIQLTQAASLLGISHRLQHRLGLIPTIAVLQLAAGTSLALLAHNTAMIQAAALYGIFTILQRMCDPAIQCLLMNATPPAERGMATALCYFAGSLAQAVSGAVGGYVLERAGYGSMLGGLALVAVVSAASFGLLLPCLPASFTSKTPEIP